MRGRVGLLVGAVGLVGLAGVSALLVVVAATGTLPSPPAPTRFEFRAAPTERPLSTHGDAGKVHDEPPETLDYAFRKPSGLPSTLTCDEARRIIRQARGALAYTPPAIAPGALATATEDWLDPYGLWTASSDSPVAPVVEEQGAHILRELESGGSAPCDASRTVGEALVTWTRELGARFDETRRTAAAANAARGAKTVMSASSEALFEDANRTARALAITLGEHAGRLERGLGSPIRPYLDAARERYFPPFDAEGWAGVVRAAAVRAYVQIMDPHGAWAARDEGVGVYDVDLDAHPPDRLWDVGVLTAIGVRVDSGPMDPLETGDVVLSIAGVATAGLPVEQLDELVYATTDAPEAAPLVVLRAVGRAGDQELRTLELPEPDDAPPPTEAPAPPLRSYRVPYGAGDALVVEIHDVRSDLGDELSETIRRAVRSEPRSVEGLLIDLRDDGGGSTEGAIAALGLFLPGATLFPMMRRDGSIEVDRAPEPPPAERWTRPVATLVDEDTASAAEMMAGALRAYGRGTIVGRLTYGKGCAQEYLDDETQVGVLRLTTLLYALPDGSPVQGVGLEPSLLLGGPMGRAGGMPDTAHEREGDAPNAPPTWRGPDVREQTLVLPPDGAFWPDPHGGVGPCPDADVCKALKMLGSAGHSAASKRQAAALTSPVPGIGRR